MGPTAKEDELSHQLSVISGQLQEIDRNLTEATNEKKKTELEQQKRVIAAQKERLATDLAQLTQSIPVPPKYSTSDFQSTTYWRLRGKLDVPKERWVSFPYCEGDDGTLAIAWAGYDHLQLARAISAYYVDVQERIGGRDDPRLVPLLACLLELLPWLKQWHNEFDSEFRMKMGDYFEGFVQDEARLMGMTPGDIKAWQPPRRTSRRRAAGRR